MNSLEFKVGQLLMFSLSTFSCDATINLRSDLDFLLDEMMVGSVILMGKDIRDSDQLLTLTSEIQHNAEKCGHPALLISTDQEGGRVSRLPSPPFRNAISARLMASGNDCSNAYTEYSQLGSELRSHGINWALAPILDVNDNPNNPVIGDRSFSDKANIVSEFGVCAVKGLQECANVLACGKHFPGHGNTSTDSHTELPVVNRDLNYLRQNELLPFAAAIEAGIGSIMTAHIMLPLIDPKLPATLSKLILTDLLRLEMGFKGLIVTDSLSMHAISKNWDVGLAAELAIAAGADIVLCVGDREIQRSIRNGVLTAVKNGRISEERIDQSVARVQLAKSTYRRMN